MADYLLNAFVTLLVTIDPIGLAPIFLSLTQGMSGENRRQTALRATAIAACVLFVFALIGQKLITFLGITIPAFRISGGLLLFWIAFEMVFERRDRRKQATAKRALTEEHSVGADDAKTIAVFPLAIPLISGPGAISATILLASTARGPVQTGGLLIVIAALIGSCLAVFLVADRLDRFLGETGRVVLMRLLGLILAALAVQFVADGIVAIMKAAQATTSA